MNKASLKLEGARCQKTREKNRLVLPQTQHVRQGSAVIITSRSPWLFPSSPSLDPVKAPKFIGVDGASLSLFHHLACFPVSAVPLSTPSHSPS